MDTHGMDAKFFDNAVNRAHALGLTARRLAGGRWAVDSGSQNGVTYITTADACTCPGHQHHGRCYHRAYVIFLESLDGPAPTPAPATCAMCGGTGRVTKPSSWFPGKTTEGFCPACTAHYDFHAGRLHMPVASRA